MVDFRKCRRCLIWFNYMYAPAKCQAGIVLYKNQLYVYACADIGSQGGGGGGIKRRKIIIGGRISENLRSGRRIKENLKSGKTN